MFAGFFVLVLLAYRTYQSDPPIPDRAVDPSGQRGLHGDDVRDGQKVFLEQRPHGGTARSSATAPTSARTSPPTICTALRHPVRDQLGGGESTPRSRRTIRHFQANRYDSATRRSSHGAAGARVRTARRQLLAGFFDSPTTRYGLRPRPIDDPEQIHQLTAFFAWSAWAAATRRPRATTTPTPTTGRPRSRSGTRRAPTSSSGRWSR